MCHVWFSTTCGHPGPQADLPTRRKTGLITFSALHAAREVSSARWALAGVSLPCSGGQQTHHVDINEAVETRREEKKVGELTPCSCVFGLAFCNCRELWRYFDLLTLVDRKEIGLNCLRELTPMALHLP